MENNNDDDKIVTYLITKLEELLKNSQFNKLSSSIFDIEVFDVDVHPGDDYYKMPKSELDKVLDKWVNKKLFQKIKNRWQPKFSVE